MPKNNNSSSESFEKKLFKAADKLRKNIDAAGYKHVVLGLIFLKYISDSFEELHQKLQKGEGEYEGADPDLKADYIIANPPFNQSDWGQKMLRNDPRWQYGTPPPGNANFAWMQHMIYHLAPKGVMGLVLANGGLLNRCVPPISLW